MKKNTFLLVVFAFLFSATCLAQSTAKEYSRKGSLYFYWGWNRCAFTNSDIRFTSDNYDFTLDNVKAKDRATAFSLEQYFAIDKFTIPQYNFRLGYFFNEKYDLSFGIDHLKYVMIPDQIVNIHGFIRNTLTFHNNENYQGEDVLLSRDLLRFEHTDGLNYLNLELRRTETLLEKKVCIIEWVGGASLGLVVPRTNAQVLSSQRYDEFHLSGYGLGLVTGAKFLFLRTLFFQTELKGGFINMPNIRTTYDTNERANQHFFYGQFNILFGAQFRLTGGEKD